MLQYENDIIKFIYTHYNNKEQNGRYKNVLLNYKHKPSINSVYNFFKVYWNIVFVSIIISTCFKLSVHYFICLFIDAYIKYFTDIEEMDVTTLKQLPTIHHLDILWNNYPQYII